jgi:type IX secretion system PorP/SprF family membrane protein
MFDALSVNPGLTGINDYYKLTVGFRDQWVQIHHAYVTYFASYDQKIELYNSGIGFQVYRDVDGGVYSRTSGELFYSYQFQLSNDFIVSPGLQLAMVQRAMNISGMTLPDREIYTGDNRSVIFPDFGFGVAANYSDKYSFGFAAHHLNAPFETLSEIDNKRTPLRISAHLISYFPFDFGKFGRRQFVFSPGFYFRNQQYQNFLQLGMNLAYDPIFAGFWVRASAFKPEAAIFMIGLELPDCRIAYNFDYKLANSTDEFPGTGAHEIVLSWKFHPKKQWRAIKCSKFSLESMNRKKKY